MPVFRSPMEKILDQQEDETVITNPKDRFRTFLRKMAYRYAVWKDRLRRLLTRERDE